MKKILLLLAVVMLCGVYGAEVTAFMARNAAGDWLAKNGGYKVDAGVDRGRAVVTVSDTNEAETVLWHQVPLTGGGWAIVAPVTEIEPVVAVLEKGFKDGGDIPANHPLRTMLEQDMRSRLRFLGLYKEDAKQGGGMRLMAAAPLSAEEQEKAENAKQVAKEWGEQANAKWAKITAPKGMTLMESTSTAVNDIYMEARVVDGFERNGRYTHWNQTEDDSGKLCYNYYSPNGWPCGCVATAAAAVMQFFGKDQDVPAACAEGYQFEGRIPSTYDEPKPNMRAIGGDYNWGTLFGEAKTRADYRVLSDEQRELLGRVVYDIGVGVGMNYEYEGSGAYTLNLAHVLRDQYGYGDARAVQGFGQEHYGQLIYNQCRAGYPVIMSIEGHAVVAVGYGVDIDGNERVRVFMGWGGTGDAWYALPYIDTKSTVGGANYLSTVVRGVVTMIAAPGETDTVAVCARMVPAVTGEATLSGDGLESPLTVAVTNGFAACRVAPAEEVRTLTLASGALGLNVSFTIGSDVEALDPVELVKSNPQYILYKNCFSNEYVAASLCGGAEPALPKASLAVLLKSQVALDYEEAMKLGRGYVRNPVTKRWELPDNPTYKPVLMFSGTFGTQENPTVSDMAFEMLRDLEEKNENDFIDRFIVFVTDYRPGALGSDGNPSLAVFEPREMRENEGWADCNRVAYWSVHNYLWTDSYDALTNGLPNDVEVHENNPAKDTWSVVATNELDASGKYPVTVYYSGAYVTNGVLDMLTNGWETCNAAEAQIGLDIRNKVKDSNLELTGMNQNFPQGEALMPQTDFTLEMPVCCTNTEQGVVYRCTGWRLSGNGKAIKRGTNAKCKFNLERNTQYALEWEWTREKFRVTGEAEDSEHGGKVVVLEEWVDVGGTAVAVAQPGSTAKFEGRWSYMSMVNNTFGTEENDSRVGVNGISYGTKDGIMFSWVVTEPAMAVASFDPIETSEQTGTGRVTVKSKTFIGTGDWRGAAYKAGDWKPLTGATAPATKIYGVAENREMLVASASGASVELPRIQTVLSIGKDELAESTNPLETKQWRCVGWSIGENPAKVNEGNAVSVRLEDVASATVVWYWEEVRAVEPPATQPEEELKVEIKWNETMDNLQAGEMVLKTAAELPAGFDPGTVEVGEPPKGWKAGTPKIDDNGNLVVPLSMDAEVLTPEPKEGAAAPLAIRTDADGKIVVDAAVGNGVKGFWYVLYGADELTGPWTAVESQQAKSDGAIELRVEAAKKFYKVAVEDSRP